MVVEEEGVLTISPEARGTHILLGGQCQEVCTPLTHDMQASVSQLTSGLLGRGPGGGLLALA
jgi:hypothetical protein